MNDSAKINTIDLSCTNNSFSNSLSTLKKKERALSSLVKKYQNKQFIFGVGILLVVLYLTL